VRLGLYNLARIQRKNFIFREHGINARISAEKISLLVKYLFISTN